MAESADVNAEVNGYDCEFVEKPPSIVQTECLVCLQVLREPYQVTCCGKSFCHSCIERVKAGNNPCPHCNTRNFNDFHNKGLQQLLYQLKVQCSHQKDGCKWTGELGELDNHLNLEPKSTQEQLEGCPYAVIECYYHPIGCDQTKLPRNEMKIHNEEKAKHHLKLLDAKCVSNCAVIKQMEKGIQKYCPYPPHVLTLNKYNKFLRSKNDPGLYMEMPVWKSAPFYTHQFGYKMNLQADLDLDQPLSLKVEMMKGEFDDQLEWGNQFTPLEVSVEVVNPSNSRENKKVCIRVPKVGSKVEQDRPAHFNSKESRSIIKPKDMPNYVNNDKVTIRISSIRELPKDSTLPGPDE